MNERSLRIRGSGGGKSGGGSGGVSEEPDSLASVAYVQIVEVIGEGEIEGLVNNEYSIYLDGVPLRDLEGTPNYRPFISAFRTGTQDQSYIDGFSGTLQTTDVSTKITKSGGRISRAIPDQYADVARVTVSVNALSETTDKGEIKATSVQFRVGVRKGSSGAWKDTATLTISGKTSSKYQRSIDVQLSTLGTPLPEGFQVSVERITDDSTSGLLINDIYWDAYTAINNEKFTYPLTAMAAVRLDARYFSSVPTRNYHVRGRRIAVPMNYDPVARVYATTGPGTTSGAWDGTFKIAYSNNPAWCYYDMLISTRYGLGRRLSVDPVTKSSQYIDKFAIYEAGRYCDEKVPTGLNTQVLGVPNNGGFDTKGVPYSNVPMGPVDYEPRFTMNTVINTQQDAYRLLGQLASVMRGLTYWAGSQFVMAQDRPAGVEFILNNANVKNGKFSYQGSSRGQRRTVVIVGWNDPAENFRQRYEYVQDLEGIKRWGVRSEDVIAIGCTSQAQARRYGLWFLYTEKAETEGITTVVGNEGVYILPGMVGEVWDTNRSGVRWGGRLLAATTTTVTLDKPTAFGTGSYTFKVRLPDGTIGSSVVNISVGGEVSELTLVTALPSVPIVGAIWGMTSQALSPRIVRCISRGQEGPDGYNLFFVEHNPSKYEAIETGAALKQYDFSNLDMDTVVKITGLSAKEVSYKPFTGAPTKTTVVASWDTVTSPLHKGFKVQLVNAGYTFKVPEQRDPTVVFEDVSPGTYNFSVWEINQFGKVGPEARQVVVVTGVDSVKPAQVTGFTYVIEGMNGVRLKWTPLDDYIDAYVVREGATWDTGVLVGEGKSDSLPAIQMTSNLHKFWIKARDTSLNYSDLATYLAVDLLPIEKPTLSHTFQDGQVIFNWSEVSSPLPVVAYDFKYGTDWNSGAPVGSPAKGPFQTGITWTDDRNFMVRARDSAGNLSDVTNYIVNIGNPVAPTGLAYTFSDSDVVITWLSANGPVPIKEFEVRYGEAAETSTFVARTSAKTINIPATWPAGGTNARKFWVYQIDQNGNIGVPASVSVTIVAPAAPTLSGVFDGAQFRLDWTPGAGSLRIDESIIRWGTSFASGTPVANLKAGTFTSPVNWGGARTFWVACKDSGGNVGAASSVVLTVSLPAAPTVTSQVNQNYAASIAWSAVTGTLPVVAYQISWTLPDGSTKVFVTSALNYTTDITWVGNKTFTVQGIDSANNVGAAGTSVLVIVVPETPVVAPAVQAVTEFILSWTATQGSLPIKEFDVLFGPTFAGATFFATLTALTLTVKGSWSGLRTFYIVARDTAGNVSLPGSVGVTIVPPIATVITSNVIDNNVLLRWTDATQTMPIANYNVYRAQNQVPFDQAILIGTLLGRFSTVFENTKGFYDYYVTSVDTAGNVSPLAKVTAYVNQPPDYQIQLDRNTDFNGENYEYSTAGNFEGWTVTGATEVVADGVLTLTSTGADPILLRQMTDQFFYGCEHPILVAKVTRIAGSGWDGIVTYSTSGHIPSMSYNKTVAATIAVGATAVIVWDMASLTAGGDDWMASRIESIKFELGSTSADVFKIDWIRMVTWRGTNVLLQEDNTLLLPVNTAESYSSHFTTRSWAGPQDQVTAGFPKFIQPVPLTATYEQVIDYGAVLPGTQIQVVPTANVGAGTLASIMTLSVKKLWTDTWVDTVGQSNIYASDFRYIKITIAYTGVGEDDFIQLTNVNIKLSLKIRSDQGSTSTGGPVHVQGNLIDYSIWAAGNNQPTGWTRQGSNSENDVALRTGPNGSFPTELCWISKNTDTNSNLDGGFITPAVSVNPNSAYLAAVFVKSLSQAGQTRFSFKDGGTYTLAGATSTDAFVFDADVPATGTWYLLVGLLHEVSYGTTDLGISGVYDMTGTKVASGTEYKQQPGSPSQYIRAYQYGNTVDTAIEIQQFLRPVLIECDVASASDLIKYVINCATKDGVYVPFTTNPIDVSSVSVNVVGSKPLIPMYDFKDIPYPKGMNVFVFDDTGAFVKAPISWSINGTW